MDDADLREFVHTQYPQLVGAVTLMCGSRATAEDAVQEALARAWERSLRGEHLDSLPAWITTVSMNLARSGLRRLRVERRTRVRLASDASDSSAAADTRIDLRRALRGLPRRQREATVLRYYLGLDVLEIARVMGDGVSRDPTWSPDGSSIVHVGSATGEFRESDLFAIAPDGTGRVQLTDDNAPEEDPVFSPDGALVAFTRFAHGDGSACELMLMEPDGSAARVIATKDTLGGCPVSLSWQPILEGEDEVSPIPTPTPSPTDESLPSGERDHAVSLEGVPFLVCDIDAFTWRYSTEGIGQAFTFEQAMGDVCDARVEGPQYLGVTTEGGEAISRADAYFGPLTRCVEPTGCWIYASVELIDGDREDEILVGTNGFPGGIEVWFFDVTSVDGRYEVMPFESECPANADCDPMMIHRIDWELPGLNGASCGRYALHGSYSYSAGEFFEWTSDTGDGWTADRWEFRDGQAAVDNLREVVSHGDPRNEFAPSDDSQICLAPAAVAPSVLDG